MFNSIHISNIFIVHDSLSLYFNPSYVKALIFYIKRELKYHILCTKNINVKIITKSF
jgi:hypothetical protein